MNHFIWAWTYSIIGMILTNAVYLLLFNNFPPKVEIKKIASCLPVNSEVVPTPTPKRGIDKEIAQMQSQCEYSGGEYKECMEGQLRNHMESIAGLNEFEYLMQKGNVELTKMRWYCRDESALDINECRMKIFTLVNEVTTIQYEDMKLRYKALKKGGYNFKKHEMEVLQYSRL